MPTTGIAFEPADRPVPISRFKSDPAASRWQPRDINDVTLNYSHFLLSPVLLMKTKKHLCDQTEAPTFQ